jgi:hypothetical protein
MGIDLELGIYSAYSELLAFPFLLIYLFYVFLFYLLFFLLWDWGLNLGLHTKQALYHLSHISSPFFSGYFGDRARENCLTGLASKPRPS